VAAADNDDVEGLVVHCSLLSCGAPAP
jgi:hypothetical protein